MEDFAKKLIVLVLLAAFFGALFLEFPIFYKKIQNGEISTLNFLRVPTQNNRSKTNYNDSNQQYSGYSKEQDRSHISKIYVEGIDNLYGSMIP